MKVRECRDCRVPMVPQKAEPREGSRRHFARGLCQPCYQRHQYRGTLDRFDGVNYGPYGTRALVEDAAFVLDCCCPCHRGERTHWGVVCSCGGQPALAARLGVTRAALQKALSRARNAETPPTRR